MAQPVGTIKCVDNIFVKRMVFLRAGDVELPHNHAWSHPTLVARGRVRVTVDGKSSEFGPDSLIYIRKGKMHSIEALEDNTCLWCIHALRTGDGVGDLLDPEDYPLGIDPREFSKPLTNT